MLKEFQRYRIWGFLEIGGGVRLEKGNVGVLRKAWGESRRREVRSSLGEDTKVDDSRSSHGGM